VYQARPGGEDATGIDAVAVAEWLVDIAPAYVNLINDSYETVTFTETLDGTGQGQRVSAGFRVSTRMLAVRQSHQRLLRDGHLHGGPGRHRTRAAGERRV